MKESGHYSIAGFFFQQLAAASDALKLYFSDDSNTDPVAVFVLEKHGQDGVVRPVRGNTGRTKLIQYKYSSVGAKIEPSDLRDILDAFLRSVKASGCETKDFEYCLTTNRERDDEANRWFAESKSPRAFKEFLHKNLDADSAKKYKFTVLYPIFSNLTFESCDLASCKKEIAQIADRHGMHDHEVEIGINAIVGFLDSVAKSPGEREVTRQLLIKNLLGRNDPTSLTEDRSHGVQQAAVEQFKDFETDLATTTDREIFREIADAASMQPFVLVRGEGGCGKSVAMSGAAMANLASRGIPPGFALIVKASELSSTSIQRAVAEWRHQVENPDQNSWRNSVSRLERACPGRPCLAVYVDGVDERNGLQGLPPEARGFLTQLIFDACKEYSQSGVAQFSVVISCRNQDDLRGLSGGGFGFPFTPTPFVLKDFTPKEILSLLNELRFNETVTKRIRSHLSLRHGNPKNTSPSSDRPIDPTRMNIIHHPVLWRCFANLTNEEKHDFLDGGYDALSKLASTYIQWFYAKVEKRVGNLVLNAAQIALTKSAQRFADDPERDGFRKEDWLDPCVEAGCPEISQDKVFQEAISAGVIDANQQTWKWKRPWLCEFLAKGVT